MLTSPSHRRKSSAGDNRRQLTSISGEARLPFEISFRSLRDGLSAEDAVMALTELDDIVLYADDARLGNLSSLCPSDAQKGELAVLVDQIRTQNCSDDQEGCEKQ